MVNRRRSTQNDRLVVELGEVYPRLTFAEKQKADRLLYSRAGPYGWTREQANAARALIERMKFR